ncbi:sulfatase family protein [Paenibacillus sacheonensis]|uniref:Sulfatase-like hydrolase/transferase n=1 Tax=Paenibacillus sacheonensis TaxID=742054 RepID=A0A7X4YVI9_9BACL|nr:sulfatase [Paenibacillus sacheonensis]MBM7568544.1 arylsulfatase A-like enzyme [Paenibacillus sacheonensis]NBC72369.1 sulfatase-like hydrolase/transferase [Paenibacillus sacheonensis]
MRVLLLDLDSTRPDHLGCYGYGRNTSPNIDRIAAEGVRFDNYYTSDAPCFPSRTALMTGRFGIHNGVVGHGGTAADVRHEGEERQFRSRLASESFPSLFRQAGMKTALVSPFGERHSAWTFYAGFNEIHNTGQSGQESAETVTPVVLDWIERNADQDDWMLYVNYWDPHTPYRAPASFGNPFENEPLPAWITEDVLEGHMRKVGPHSASEINMYNSETSPAFPRHPGEIRSMDGLRTMIDGYDCGIRYMDENIGAIFDLLERKGVMEELIVIITADHGENMGELGIYGEHATADQGTCRIPMIIRWPGLQQGTVDRSLHYHLDLPPTIAELLGRAPAPIWDGSSYAGVLKTGEENGRDYLVVSQCAHVCQRSVRFGDWLYIRTYHDGYHLFDKEMLYNLAEDPHEQHNAAKDRPDLCREAVYLLNEWHDDMMSTMPHDVDPLWTVIKEGGPYHAKGFLPQYAERLRQTGRGDAVEELIRRHPREMEQARS